MASAADTLKTALAETWAFYFQCFSFHWNVEGENFRQLHEFFGALYEDAGTAVDGLAEQVRALGQFAPASLSEIDKGSKITFSDTPPDAMGMVAKLAGDNDIVIGALNEAQHAANDEDHQGLANYLQDRLNLHAKWGWMLRATLSQPATVADVARQKPADVGGLLDKMTGGGGG